jgi:hypothetical protein
MKFFLQTVLINLLFLSVYSQNNITSRITHIENGLTQEVISFDMSAINKMKALYVSGKLNIQNNR